MTDPVETTHMSETLRGVIASTLRDVRRDVDALVELLTQAARDASDFAPTDPRP